MPHKIPIATNAAPPSVGTHTQAIRVGDLVFTTGQTGRDLNGKLAEGLEAQTRQMLANLEVILNAAGCSLSDIVRVNLMMADLKTFKAIDQIYAAWLPDRATSPLPTRSAHVAAQLPAGALVMMDVIAAYPGE
ncbi:MAG: hypothetical protein GKR95_16425 [Gammaproteobacteria bacterium]|nr:hypothetical protein [Gammaproteobacteria bacterium]NKB63626.1 hypothetical protein [Gammaproteobacteria bacterium]